MIDFFFLTDPNVRWVVFGVILMGFSSGMIGVFAFLRKRSLAGDAVAHAILPGICIAFMLTGVKSAWVLMIGAITTGWLALWSIDIIVRNSKIKPDAAIALVLSVFYGVGILLLTAIQSTGNAQQSGLDKFLFGKAASMMWEDVIVFAVFGIVMLLVILVLYKSFKIISFDRDFALTKGFPVRRLETILSLLTVSAVAIGIQAIGVVLMAALLITPAASARYWTHRLGVMLALAGLFGALAGFLGTYISYLQPKMPTGPWVVVSLALITIISVLFGSRKGVLARYFQGRRNRKKILEENILKCLYHLGEGHQDFELYYSEADIQQRRFIPKTTLQTGLRQLIKKQLLDMQSGNVALTEKGVIEAKRITRIHRLWELYLTTHLNLPIDHVHEDAEAIEHIITPELEQELELHLNHPTEDPHHTVIPYGS